MLARMMRLEINVSRKEHYGVALLTMTEAA